MPIATITEYSSKRGTSKTYVFPLPMHCTTTGREDHFALAMHDAWQILAGMKAMAQSSALRIEIQAIDLNQRGGGVVEIDGVDLHTIQRGAVEAA